MGIYHVFRIVKIVPNCAKLLIILHCRGEIVLGRTHPCKVDMQCHPPTMQCHPPTLLFSKCGTSRVKRFFEEGETGSSLIYSKINFQIKLKLIPQQEFLSFFLYCMMLMIEYFWKNALK